MEGNLGPPFPEPATRFGVRPLVGAFGLHDGTRGSRRRFANGKVVTIHRPPNVSETSYPPGSEVIVPPADQPMPNAFNASASVASMAKTLSSRAMVKTLRTFWLTLASRNIPPCGRNC